MNSWLSFRSVLASPPRGRGSGDRKTTTQGNSRGVPGASDSDQLSWRGGGTGTGSVLNGPQAGESCSHSAGSLRKKTGRGWWNARMSFSPEFSTAAGNWVFAWSLARDTVRQRLQGREGSKVRERAAPASIVRAYWLNIRAQAKTCTASSRAPLAQIHAPSRARMGNRRFTFSEKGARGELRVLEST